MPGRINIWRKRWTILRLEHQYVITFRLAAHTGRSGGHSGNGDSPRLGPVRKQAVNIFRRDMAFDHVPVDHGGMAGLKRLGHPGHFLNPFQVFQILNLHRMAVALHMGDPAFAAAAGRGLVNGHFGCLDGTGACHQHG